MIVVCTGCSAKFRVADEKVGPSGAKLRCSRCRTVFRVQRPVEVPAPAAPEVGEDPFPPEPDVPLRATPPPLPRRATTLDARAAFEVDLEPNLGAAPAPTDPFGAPVGAGAGEAGKASSRDRALQDDPFAAEAALDFEVPPPAALAPSAVHGADLDPFASPGPAGADPLEGFGAPAPAATAFPVGPGAGNLLSLEELTTPPARRLSVSIGPPPMAVLGATEDPFAGVAPLEAGLSDLDDGVLARAVPASGASPRPPAPLRAEPDLEPPLQLDPFGAAAVAADPLAVDEPRRAGSLPPAEPTGALRVEVHALRFREVMVSAMALAALLLLALAILVVWRGGLSPAEAFRPSAILAALAPRPPAGSLVVTGVTSGLYERARGAPLLFVRGTVRSTASTPLEGVRVVVEVVRDGAVLARGDVPAGAVPGPEALHGAVDAAALSEAYAAVAAAGRAPLAPGASAPFLAAFADAPAGLAGAALRVRPVAGGAPGP